MTDKLRWFAMMASVQIFFLAGALMAQDGDPGTDPLYDANSRQAPHPSKDKYPVGKGIAWPNEIRLQPLEKSYLFIDLKGDRVNIELQFRTAGYRYEIWKRHDSLVDLMIADCATRDCSDWHKQEEFFWPHRFVLRIFLNRDSAIYKIDVDRKSAQPISVIDSVKNSNFEMHILKKLPAGLLFVQLLQYRLEPIKSADATLSDIMKPILLPAGYYNLGGQIIKIEVRSVAGRNRRNTVYNVSPYGAVIFYQIDASQTVAQAASRLKVSLRDKYKMREAEDYVWALLP